MRYSAAGDRISVAITSFDQESSKVLPKPTEHLYLIDKADWFPLNENDGIKKLQTMERVKKYFDGNETC